MEFNYDLGGKLLTAILFVLVVSDQLTTPAADPRDGDATPVAAVQPRRNLSGPAGSVDLRSATLEEASLLLKLAERSIAYADAPLAQAAAALRVDPSDAPRIPMKLSPSKRRPRRAAADSGATSGGISGGIPGSSSDGISGASSGAISGASAAEAAAVAGRSVHYEAADPRCQPTLHAGFSGGSLNWGMSFKVETAQECCDACRAHAAKCVDPAMAGQVYLRRRWGKQQIEERCAATMTSNEAGTHKAQPCNVFVFCPTRPSDGGLCWSNDVHNHTYGECWLKNQADPSRPEAGAYGSYPAAYRRKHRTAPEKVQWMSGSLSQTPLTVDGPKWHW